MPQLINVGTKLFRVNSAKNCLDISYTGGPLWVSRSKMGPRFGRLKDLLWYHDKLYALTETGIWYSRNEGADWGVRGSGSIAKSLVALQDGGKDLLGLHQNGGLYRSYNEGADWVRIGG